MPGATASRHDPRRGWGARLGSALPVGGLVLFNSYPFVFVFLPLVAGGVRRADALGDAQGRAGLSDRGSLAFYAWWNWRFLFLIVFSILFNFSLGTRLQRLARRHGASATPARRLLVLGIAVNLGLLGLLQVPQLPGRHGRHGLGTGGRCRPSCCLSRSPSSRSNRSPIWWMLIDGDTGDYDFLSYCLFISFFPHLIAGPIVRFRELVPQFSSAGTFVFSPGNVPRGCSSSPSGCSRR